MKKIKPEPNSELEDLSEDIDEIGKDTDAILRKISTTLQELTKNTGQTKSTKKWVQMLFIVDKVIMLFLMLLAFHLGRSFL